MQTGKLAFLFRHHVWQGEITIEVTIIITLTYDLSTLPVSKMTICTGPCQARQGLAKLWSDAECWHGRLLRGKGCITTLMSRVAFRFGRKGPDE